MARVTSCGSIATLRDQFNALRAEVVLLRTLANELKSDHNALLTKLDADAGVTDANYASLRSVAAADSSGTHEDLTES